MSGIEVHHLENIDGDDVKVLVYHTTLEIPLIRTLLLDSIVLVGKNLIGETIHK